MRRRPTTKVSPNEFRVYREAVEVKMDKAGFSEEQISKFSTIMDRVGKSDIVEFLFMVEKVGAILPLTDVEYLETKQEVKQERQARTCAKCGKMKSRTDSKCWRCHE